MKDSVLRRYLIDSGFLCIDETEIKTIFTEDILKQEEKLKNLLDERQMKEVDHYRWKIVSHMFHIRDIECFKMLYLGVNLGIEVADFYNEENNEE